MTMKTLFRTKEQYADILLGLANEMPAIGMNRPQRFIQMMTENTGNASWLSCYGVDMDGLERKNPLIVALGDSVTAGHFEWTVPDEKLGKLLVELQKGLKNRYAIEIHDPRASYIERFREMLIDAFEMTCVSVINSGIAGDTIYGMIARCDRDVIRYQPDLVLINGSLNWNNEEHGTASHYKKLLQSLVTKIKNETQADIILLTPNGEIPMFGESTLKERVHVIREIAENEQVCLADTFAIWDAYQEAGFDWMELLSNGVNHPSTVGHEVYAMTLMKLIEPLR